MSPMSPSHTGNCNWEVGLPGQREKGLVPSVVFSLNPAYQESWGGKMEVTDEYSSRALRSGPREEPRVEQGHPQCPGPECPGLVVLALSWEAGPGRVVTSPALSFRDNDVWEQRRFREEEQL